MKKSAKVPFILLIIAVIAAIILFSVARQWPPLLWAGAGAAGIALLCLLITLTRFLRNRSITSGLFISTTAVTVIYFLATRFVSTALPMAFATVSAATVETTGNNPGVFTPIMFAQVGLFALWFLLLLFIIYVYVRPIKKIDFLLSEIIAAKEIKKLKLGKSAQYQQIADKLQILAAEKYLQEVKRQNRLAKCRARANEKKDLVAKLLKEKAKIPTPNAAE